MCFAKMIRIILVQDLHHAARILRTHLHDSCKNFAVHAAEIFDLTLFRICGCETLRGSGYPVPSEEGTGFVFLTHELCIMH